MRCVGCLLLALWAAAGCVQFPVVGTKKGVTLASEAQVTRTPPPVTADQVNELNARSKVQALREELDRAASTEPNSGVKKPVLSR